MKKNHWKDYHMKRMYLVLALSFVFFACELVVSHVTHSLTLLAASYHMLCNIFSLIGCVITIKMCQKEPSVSNTFGWARLEVVAMVVNLLFLAALNFSLLVEAVQTMVHVDHMDAMHHPITVCILAVVGLFVNAICILVIGGYTHHQGSFLVLTPEGDVVIKGNVTEDAVRQGMRRLPSTIQGEMQNLQLEKQPIPKQRMELRPRKRWPSFRSVFRDVNSCILVIVTSIIVYVDGDGLISLYVDPIASIVTVIILSATSYPFMLQAGKILLQTTPDHIDVNELQSHLLETFPSIVNIHDLHIWTLTPSRIISTAHILFMNDEVYLRIKDQIENYFHSQGITHITLQPEFYQFGDLQAAPSKGCIFTCDGDICSKMKCCEHGVKINPSTPNDVETSPHGHSHEHRHHSESKCLHVQLTTETATETLLATKQQTEGVSNDKSVNTSLPEGEPLLP